MSQRHRNGRFYGANVVCYTCRPEISRKNHPIMIILHAYIFANLFWNFLNSGTAHLYWNGGSIRIKTDAPQSHHRDLPLANRNQSRSQQKQ